TSGVYMCAVAIALGYKEIYLSGIDFYQNGSSYAFDTKQENLLKLAPDFKNDRSHYIGHSKNTDIKALEFLEKTYKIKLYCLCPNSLLANFIELAPNLNSNFIIQEKNNYTKDILIPSSEAYGKFSKNINFKKIKIKENVYYKLIKDLLRLPSDIKHYFKGK
ncbi:alpha-2,3 sialyltransferase, partial [Campylobacter jejuni]|nr:alpha-2,3 sialyltransferase [Campylobacter jejuni]